MRTLESFGAFLRGYHANTGVVEDEPSAGTEVVLCLNLTVASCVFQPIVDGISG